MQNKIQNSEETEAEIRRRQRDFLSERYIGASLSQIRAPEWAQSKLIAWLDNPKGFLVYHGGPGIGKTYLCAALIEWAYKKFRFSRYYNERQLLTRLREKIQAKSGDYIAELKGLLDDDLIILDDIGSSGVNEWRQEVLFEAIDLRYNSKLPTVITSNFTQSEFEILFHARFCSRLFAVENTIIDGSEFPDFRKTLYQEKK